MASNSKNQDVVELIIKGQDEYSDVSEDVRQELEELSAQAWETRSRFDELERSLDLADVYREQEAEVNRLAQAQAEAKQAVDRLAQANKEAKGENLETVQALAKAKAELGSYRTATNRAQKALDKTRDSMRQYGVSLEEVERNQTDLRQSSEQLADELSDLQGKQRTLVSDARDQVEASMEKARAQKEYNDALRQQSDAMSEQFRAYSKHQAEQKRVQAETEKLTTEIQAQIDQLQRGEIGWNDYQRRVKDAGASAGLTRKQVADINRSLEEQALSARRANQALVEQAAEAMRIERATKDYRRELEKLIDQYRHGQLSTQQFSKAEAELRSKMNLTADQVAHTRKAMKGYASQIEVLPQAQKKVSTSSEKLMAVTKRLAGAYLGLEAAQRAAQGVVAGYSAYTQSENAMLGLQKTTNLTASEVNGLAAEMDRLSSEVTPTTAVKLLEIAEATGRMGVQGAENIRAFTKSIDALSSATGLAGDKTAEAIAQILNVTGEAQSNVVGVAASIAELGNTTATTEEDIVHFANRLASDTASLKLTSAEVLGLSAGMAEMGLQAEGASTVIGRTFRYIEDAVKSGGKPMQELQRITGMTADELEEAFGQSKVQLFNQFLAGLNRTQDGGETLNSILDDMNFKSDENARILGLLAQRHEGVAGAVSRSNDAFEKGDAHFEEMAQKAASLESGYTRLQNRITTLKTAMGEAFGDDLSRFMDGLTDDGGELEEMFASLGEQVADSLEAWAGLIEAVKSIWDVLDGVTGASSTFAAQLELTRSVLHGLFAGINLLVGGIAELGIAWNKFWGDTDDVAEWTKIQEDAFVRVEKSMQRHENARKRMNGLESSAFQDLRDAYHENSDALSRLDDEQRKAVETIIKQTGYLEGNDQVYRTLTRSIQRAADVQRIKSGLTEDEGVQLQAHIDLLKAQGKTEEEAARIAQAAAEQRRQESEEATKEEEKRIPVTKAIREELEYLQQANDRKAQAEARSAQIGVASADSQSAAMDRLKQSIDDVAHDGMGNLEQKSLQAFDSLTDRGVFSSDKVLEAFQHTLNSIKSNDAIDLLKQRIQQLGEQGQLSAADVQAALAALDQRLSATNKNISDAWKTLKLDVDEVTGALTEQGEAGAKAFETLVQSGEYTSGQLRQAFDAALSQATTQADVEALIGVLEKAGQQGKAAGDLMAYGFVNADRKLSDLKSTLDSSLKDSLRELGVDIEKIETGFSEMGRQALDHFADVQQAMKDTGVSGKQAAEITREAFDAALDDISTKKGLDELKEKVTAAFRDGRMAASDYVDALDDIKAAYDEVADASDSSTSGQMDNLKKLWQQARDSASAIAAAYGKGTSATEDNTRAEQANAKAAEQGGYAKWRATRATEASSDANKENAKTLRALTQEMTAGGKTQEEWAAMGSKMAERYRQIALNTRDILNSTKEGTLGYIAAMRKADDYLGRAGRSAIQAWERQRQKIEEVEKALERGSRVSESMLAGLDLIDEQRLDGVRGAIKSLNNEARQVNETLKGTVASLRQELAGLRGDQEAAERIAYQQKMLDLEQQYQEAKSTGDRESARLAREAIGIQRQIHQEKMRQLKDQKSEESASPADESPMLPDSTAVAAGQGAGAAASKVIRLELDLGAGAPVAGYYDEQSADLLIRQLQSKRSVT